MKSMKVKHDMNVSSSMSDGYFPSLQISTKAIPELMDEEIDDECEIKLKVKIKSISKSGVNVDVIAGEYVESKEDYKEGDDE